MLTDVRSLRGSSTTSPVIRRLAFWGLLLAAVSAGTVFAQGTPPLTLFNNYFVTGDYVVAGWVEGPPDYSGYAPGTISVPDLKQPAQPGVPAAPPPGAQIVAAYMYWATVEGNGSTYVGQTAFFNGYQISGTVLGNPNAPTSWSSGGCNGSSGGSKTMRTYRADVRPYLPLDVNTSSPTFGSIIATGNFPVRLAHSGSKGNTTPMALGGSLVIIYRVVSPSVPLNSIVIYDGAYAPSNSSLTMSQQILGFYQAAASPVSKLTHVVGNGQPNKYQTVMLNSVNLPSLYGKSAPAFPGIYGSWDNPTWVLGGAVKANDSQETTSVVPSPSNSGCVNWGAVVFSSTVQDSDGDGLLDVWEDNQGYTDAVSSQQVALPGANKSVKDLFVEVDYLSNLDGSAGPYLHSHLPKQAALDQVGNAFKLAGINVHFDVGPNTYQNDPYVIPSGTGGNAISEGAVLCADPANPTSATLCQYPNQAVIGWKGGLLFIRDSVSVPNSNPPIPLGNFQPGRVLSYHYLLSGHAVGSPRAFWSTTGTIVPIPGVPVLTSVVNSGSTATLTLFSPSGMLKPGDCLGANVPTECSDTNSGRLTIGGALLQTNLNGTYPFTVTGQTTDASGNTTTVLTISTSGVANGTYNYSNEPQLSVSYLGPTSSSGHADVPGGGDSMLTFGLWGADDNPGCQPDPSLVPSGSNNYCDNQVGTIQTQAGTIMHELGHTLTLTHGGTYYNTSNYP